ncbi:ATP-binding protein [Brasilonema sp. UFV-L1]|uniref:ATP-binding protein n=1 Tax=Brasilonema sp. UFV-L1 TaxID=2234130 RepID=UPI00145E9496|nr:ATP-binding protein [Brasilonema sp. UFV-L1]NMG09047.1 ATP-binding protein [Brasilonema sp. UFV-L1]
MASIDDIILRSTNPFDNFRSVNFWHKQQQSEPTVDSIHQEAIAAIEATLNQVTKDHRTRTVILDGDGGSGKTYLLGRLKKAFNHKAFFVYIPPFPQSDHIWRHILRYTVDSLVQVPEGEQDSQLLLWLVNVLSTIKQRSIKQRIVKDDIFDLLRSDRRKFINRLKDIYKQAGIYNADIFFGVLHDLTNSELYPLACEWLRGDDLSEESLQALRVKNSINTEEAARETLANFSRIAANTQPIVLCFDQLESIAHLSDGSIDLQSLFNVNTKIRDEDNNFLIIISITTNTWQDNKARIDQTHQARIDKKVDLKDISIEQAESILASRLYSLHCQANPQPNSPIYPLQREYLENEFPGKKAKSRNALILGRDIFQEYKQWLFYGKKGEFQPGVTKPEKPEPSLAAFKLKWREEFTKVQQRTTRIRHLSSPELIQILQEALAALKAEEIKTPLFTKTQFANCSLGYKLSVQAEQLGVVWTEDQMTTFFYIMKACQNVIENNPSLTLYLIRLEALGDKKNKGYKLFTQIFTGSRHRHITPDINSVHYLATYNNLVKDAREGDLVIGGKTFGLKALQAFIRDSKVFDDCSLLKDLGVIKRTDDMNRSKDDTAKTNGKSVKPLKEEIEAKGFVLDLVTTQQFMGREILIQNAHSQFPMLSQSQITQLIQQLCQEKQVQILDPTAKPEAQLICLIPKK